MFIWDFVRSYPPTTEELALLRRLGEMAGVTLRLSARRVTTAEEDAIIHAATNKNRMERSNFSNMKQSVTAEEKIQDVETLIKTTRRQTEPLIHCSCFLELSANTMEELRSLRDEVNAILIRSKLSTDPLLLRQKDGFLSSNPAGQNMFGAFSERVLPASSVANLYPISYSGKTDPMTTKISNNENAESGLLPYPVIIAATKGDPEAMNIVVQHYESYIASLSMRKLRDERGNIYWGIDEDIRDRLRSRLMRAVLSFKV